MLLINPFTKEQIQIAAGMPLSYTQSDITLRGHAIEFRINAEDHTQQFLPCPGTVNLFLPPGGKGVRIDSFIYPGFTISQYYDSMIAKIVVYGDTRLEAISRMSGALDECVIEGIETTIPLHKFILRDKDFIDGNFDTNYLEKLIKEKYDV